MSDMSEVPTMKKSFDTKMKGKSKGYQNVSKVASLNFERYCKSNGITTQKWLDDLKTKSEEDCKSTFFYHTQEWIHTLKLTHKGKRNYFGIIKKLARSNGLKISKDDVDANFKAGDIIVFDWGAIGSPSPQHWVEVYRQQTP